MISLLGNIERTTKFVSDNSKYVKIDYDKIDEILDNGDFIVSDHWLSNNPFSILDMETRDIINLLLILHTIGDYCFWGDPKWEIETDKGILDGSYAMIYLLVNRYKCNKDFNMDFDEFSSFLTGNVEIPLLKERYECLVEMNNYLDGIAKEFYDEIEDMYDDFTLLEYVINNFSYFKDEAVYLENKVFFYKRAQLFVSDILHIRELKDNVKVDYSNLRGCADYKIPQVMNCLGMLIYVDDLEQKILSKSEIVENSEMEIEIRANDLVVIDYIYEKMEHKVSRMDINDYIWLLGQDKSKINKNYHRTKTIHY